MTFTYHRGWRMAACGLAAIALAGCVSPQEQMAQDQNMCAGMGATYGSPSHTQCMLQQQQRRDDELLRYTQQAHMHSEMARNAHEMREDRRRARDQ